MASGARLRNRRAAVDAVDGEPPRGGGSSHGAAREPLRPRLLAGHVRGERGPEERRPALQGTVAELKRNERSDARRNRVLRVETLVAADTDRLAMNAELVTGLKRGFAERVELCREPIAFARIGGGGEGAAGHLET